MADLFQYYPTDDNSRSSSLQVEGNDKELLALDFTADLDQPNFCCRYPMETHDNFSEREFHKGNSII